MRLLKFLSIIQKIIIILIALCFIPILLFVYLPSKISVNDPMKIAYDIIKFQTALGGFLTSENISTTCSTPQQFALQNSLCMSRCTIGQNCFITDPKTPCFLKNQYIVGQNKYCSDLVIQNQLVVADTVSYVHNNNYVPLADIRISAGKLTSHFYCIKNPAQCSSLIDYFGVSLDGQFNDNYIFFSSVVSYMMYFGLVPLIFHILVVFVLDTWCRFNLRLTNSLMIIHESLIGGGIIICAITYYTKNDQIMKKLSAFSSSCLVTDINECQQIISPYLNFNEDDGISNTFVVFMGVVLTLQILFLIGILIINILMVKYHKLRQIQPERDSYQLQML